MIIILSPSKSINFKELSFQGDSSNPVFEGDAVHLIKQLRHYTSGEIMQKEKLSPKIALSTFEYIQTYSLKSTPKKQAVFAYSGNVYDKLNASSFNKEELDFMQTRLCLFSALYGILRPLDLIQPYRLDMKSGLIGNLYGFWRKKVTQELKGKLKNENNILINLASTEYFKIIDQKHLPPKTNIITPIFQQEIQGKFVTNSLFAKQARGLMTRFIVENRISDPENLKAFDSERYFFNSHLSSSNEWFFTR